MKAVLTVERYAPEIGGAERVVQRVAEGLAGGGHEIVVVTGGLRSSEELHGVRVERFPVRGNAVRGVRGDPSRALDLIRQIDPDVVMNYAAQSWPTDACFPLVDSAGAPAMVLAPCGFSGLHDERWGAYFERLRGLLPAYDGLIFHSTRYQDWDFARDAGAERMEVIRNGADPAPPGVGHRGFSNGSSLVTVSSHVRSKGHRDFALAIRSLRRRGRHVRGAIVAPPRKGVDAVRGCQLRCRLAALTPGNGIDLIDGTTRETTQAAIAAADVVLLPSSVECSPLVIIEAMAAGRPWVSYDVGNVAELAGGIVVDGMEGMVTAVERILDGGDPGLGEAGRAAWERDHRWERIVPDYERVLSAAAERRSRIRAAESLAARAE